MPAYSAHYSSRIHVVRLDANHWLVEGWDIVGRQLLQSQLSNRAAAVHLATMLAEQHYLQFRGVFT